jgi:hypothetical protein
MVTSVIGHLIFAYPGMYLLKRLGIVSLVRLKRFQLVLLFGFRAMLLYAFQYSKEIIFKKKKHSFRLFR